MVPRRLVFIICSVLFFEVVSARFIEAIPAALIIASIENFLFFIYLQTSLIDS